MDGHFVAKAIDKKLTLADLAERFSFPASLPERRSPGSDAAIARSINGRSWAKPIPT